MAKATHEAIRELIEIVTSLSEIVASLDPGKTRTYEHIAARLGEARKALTRAKELE